MVRLLVQLSTYYTKFIGHNRVMMIYVFSLHNSAKIEWVSDC